MKENKTNVKTRSEIYRLTRCENGQGRTKRTVYGVAVYGDGNDTERVTEVFPDISGNESEVSAFISMINREKLSPIHIREVIDDRFDIVK